MLIMPSIGQFRQIIRNVKNTAEFSHIDENDEPVFKTICEYPIIECTGTVKIHGTNASIRYDLKNEIVCQSKKNIITPNKDNAGFANFIHLNFDKFNILMKDLHCEFCTKETQEITLFGEWAGKAIQNGVAISEIDKSFFIFGIRITNIINDDKESFWVNDKDVDAYFLKNNICINNVYILSLIKSYNISIDFNKPEIANNIITGIVDEIENECPIGKYFNISGIGEGIVIKFKYSGQDFIFKAKGEKHSKSKVKVHKDIDVKYINRIQYIADQVTPNWRLEQIYQETFDTINGGKGDIKKTGDYIRSLMQDIIKEDLDIIIAASLEVKNIGKYVSKIGVKYMHTRLDEEAGLV